MILLFAQRSITLSHNIKSPQISTLLKVAIVSKYFDCHIYISKYRRCISMSGYVYYRHFQIFVLYLIKAFQKVISTNPLTLPLFQY